MYRSSLVFSAKFRITVILCSSVFLISCVTPPVAQPAPTPVVIEKERVIKKPYNAVWQRAVEWFATHNTPIKNIDKDSGLLTTEYKLLSWEHMDCRTGRNPNAVKVEITNPTGNFNVLVRKVDATSTKISVNAFFQANLVFYRYENIFSNIPIFWYNESTDCSSTGVLEKQIMDYVSAK